MLEHIGSDVVWCLGNESVDGWRDLFRVGLSIGFSPTIPNVSQSSTHVFIPSFISALAPVVSDPPLVMIGDRER